jgi:hypothetical protein
MPGICRFNRYNSENIDVNIEDASRVNIVAHEQIVNGTGILSRLRQFF